MTSPTPTTLTDAAVAAHTAMLDAAERAVFAAARDAVKAVLVAPLPEPPRLFTLTELAMTRVLADAAAGVVVWSDGTVALMAVRSGGVWTVRLTSQDAGRWRNDGAVVTHMGDVGAALAG